MDYFWEWVNLSSLSNLSKENRSNENREEREMREWDNPGITKITKSWLKKLILTVGKIITKITTKITKPKNEWILESLNFLNR